MSIFNLMFEWVGTPIGRMMKGLFKLLYLDGFPESVSFILLLGMFALLIRCWLAVKPVMQRLDSCLGELKNIPNLPNGLQDLQAFEAIIRAMRDELANCWSRFKMTLVSRGTNVGLTIQPSSFININRLGLEAPLQRFGKWSGLFVGIGLLVTFLGLVAALSSATGAINAATASENSTEEMQNALKNLLSAATVKFYTSIFGLFASLVVSYMEKFFRRKLEKKIYGLCHEIERLLPVITPEQLLAEQVYEAQQATTQLKQFNSEMSTGLVQLSGAMDKTLRDSISPVRQGIEFVGRNLGSMEQTIGEHIGKMQEKTLDILAEKLGSVVNDQAGTELNALAKTLGHLTDSLSGMTSSLENISRSVNEDMNKAQQVLQERLAVLAGELSSRGQAAAVQLTEATSKVLGTMQGSVAGVGEHVQQLNIYLEQSSQALAAHRQAISEAATQTQNASQTLERASNNLGGAASPMLASVKNMDDSVKKLMVGASTLSVSMRQTEESIKRASESLEKHFTRFEGLDKGIATTLQQITQYLDYNSTKMREYVENIDNHFGPAVSQFDDSIDELRGVLEEHLEHFKSTTRR